MPVVLHAFCRKNPRAHIPETAFPNPYLFTETESTIVDHILALLDKNRPTLHQPFNLPKRLGRIVQMRQRLAKRTTH